MIQEGATVTHVDPTINDGLKMFVKETNDEQAKALCSLNDGSDNWYDQSDLRVVDPAQSGFVG